VIHVARVYGERKRNFVGQNFWARGYYVWTVGRDERVIRAYIRYQEAEDQRLEQLNLGARIKPSFRASNITLWVKKRGKWLILSVGIIPYGNSWHASYVRRFIHRYNTKLLPIVG